MQHHLTCLTQISHLFIVAGYPTLGKSSSLWRAAQTGFPLFGEENGPVVPKADDLGDIGEHSSTDEKLKAGFWLTQSDLPSLAKQSQLPKLLILHLDLLLAYLLHRERVPPAIGPGEFATVFDRLFTHPALRRYEKCTVTTLYSPIDEVQRRWRHRYPTGIPPNSGRIVKAKDRLITDELVAGPLYAALHVAWERCLASLMRNGKLAGHLKARSRLEADLPDSR
ncbi:hypothetical protein LZ518_10335 [Sphingomonas sp. RB56-2]|uniref:Uncharacterized protein n=1 Tax=Sphingomonas brevis TaxID=2908206 RepID=A0ABT0SBR4_9SPHN|nr:hypothetical protein [Sphingomonas brevis]MCL6741530.1 hypothetical protein [Sphingomonas brevis]